MEFSDVFSKGIRSLCSDGVLETLKKVTKYLSPKKLLHKRRYENMLKNESSKEKFRIIYEQNLWISDESASGSGSTLHYTNKLRKSLPMIFEKYSVHSILDAPCGDFNWMKEVLNKSPNLIYVGVDIVEELVKKNSSRFSNSTIRFQSIDIIKDELPPSDLMIARDFLFHLSYSDIDKFIKNIARSDIKYILTTTHLVPSSHRNADIVTGDFRLIDIFSEPFCFPNLPLERIDDWVEPDLPRQMCLFEVKALVEHLSKR